MFPARYFPARYFAPRYWSEVGGAAVVVLPATLLAALKSYWNGASGLGTTVGPLVTGRANPGQTVPFVRVNLVSTSPHYTSTDGYWEDVLVQFSVFAAGAHQADILGERVKAAFDPKSTRPKLAYATGVEMTTRRRNDLIVHDPSPGIGGVVNVTHRAITYLIQVSRSM